MKIRKIASVDNGRCVACGACTKVCPRDAISVHRGVHAVVNDEACLGCGKCGRICPADCIVATERMTYEEALV